MLSVFLSMPESKQVAFYFLFGQGEDGAAEKTYIGQTGDLGARLVAHNKDKDFWQRAVVLISRTKSMTQTHTLFLEWFSIQEAKKAGRYETENGNDGSKPHTPEPLQADCLEIFDTARTLLATLGYPVFEPLVSSGSASKKDDLFFCKRGGTSAAGTYMSEGFVVLKGSKGKAVMSKDFPDHAFGKMREKLLKQGKLTIENGELLFAEDVLFNSPSGASAVVCGSTSNGWKDWKNAAGKSLHDVKRVAVASPP